jgi:hypothetical protein
MLQMLVLDSIFIFLYPSLNYPPFLVTLGNQDEHFGLRSLRAILFGDVPPRPAAPDHEK